MFPLSSTSSSCKPACADCTASHRLALLATCCCRERTSFSSSACASFTPRAFASRASTLAWSRAWQECSRALRSCSTEARFWASSSCESRSVSCSNSVAAWACAAAASRTAFSCAWEKSASCSSSCRAASSCSFACCSVKHATSSLRISRMRSRASATASACWRCAVPSAAATASSTPNGVAGLFGGTAAAAEAEGGGGSRWYGDDDTLAALLEGAEYGCFGDHEENSGEATGGNSGSSPHLPTRCETMGVPWYQPLNSSKLSTPFPSSSASEKHCSAVAVAISNGVAPCA
mmetsp:Transcript_83019/g.166095  ORF Transcript_83019/g.166095 Transcript_83019/m.166095 type:complete len:291 (-) Transcript_83019:2527-3399(-)